MLSTGPSWIYLMAANGRIKIGHSLCPSVRRFAVRSDVEEAVEVVHLIQTDDAPWAERYLHEMFADKRVEGEWFDLTEDDISYLSNIETLNHEDLKMLVASLDGRVPATLGARLEYTRRQIGLSIRQLATRSGVSESTIAAIEKGAVLDPTLDTLRNLVRPLGISVGELIGE